VLKNYLAAALRNLFRDRAYAAINIFGLALGFAATILIGLFVRDELSYDRGYPHSERIFRLQMDDSHPRSTWIFPRWNSRPSSCPAAGT
jgi:putative ABC transport system permease protein